jgi:hypothetical protein
MRYLVGFLIFISMGFVGSYKSKTVFVTTDSTIKNGNYSDPTIWSTGIVPNGASKNIVISKNTSVYLDMNVAVNSVIIRNGAKVYWEQFRTLNNICLNYPADITIENTLPNKAQRTDWNGSVVIVDDFVATDKSIRNGYWSNPATFNSNLVPNGSTRNVWVNKRSEVVLDTSVIVNRLIVTDGGFRWTKNATINGVTHENYNVF